MADENKTGEDEELNLARKVELLRHQVRSFRRTGLKADKAFLDELSGEPDEGEIYSAESIKVLDGLPPPRSPGPNWRPPKKRDYADTPEMAERRKFVEAGMHDARLAGTQISEEAEDWLEEWIRGEVTIEDILRRLDAKFGSKSSRPRE